MKILIIAFAFNGHYTSFSQTKTYKGDSSIGFSFDTTIITQIILLGTGTPEPSPDRSGPCVAF